MTATLNFIQERITELDEQYTNYTTQCDLINAERCICLKQELQDVLMVLQAELNGFKGK